ncbi:MAG: hypothetical protein HC844_21115 [Tabrizicola sp.]|nr:hypothetical protein [Tabrizicola sp.]
MRPHHLCLIAAALAGIAGIVLGIHMGIGQDFTLAPAHAHLNLLGWVTMSIYGLYHRATMARSRLVWVQSLTAAAGFPAFSGGLAVYLATGNNDLAAFVVFGSLACLLGLILFLIIVIRDAMSDSPAPMQESLAREPAHPAGQRGVS